MYIVQEHGLLNAYANRLHRKDIIVIYSDVVELAYEMGEREMAFVVCHELAHIKRGHVKNAWLHMAADLVPFLGSAYSRACEYTCDRIAAAIVPDGAVFGLVLPGRRYKALQARQHQGPVRTSRRRVGLLDLVYRNPIDSSQLDEPHPLDRLERQCAQGTEIRELK